MTLTRPPVPGFLLDFLAGHWPEGDEDAMRRLADHWSTMSGALQALQQPAEATMNEALAAIDGRIHDAMTTYWQEIGGGDASELAKLITICDSFSQQLEHGATDIEFAKLTIYASLAAMAVMAFVPGVGELVDAVALAAVKLVIRQTILKLIDRLAVKGATFLAERVGLEVAAKLGADAASNLTLTVAKNAAIGAGFGSTVDLSAQGVQVAMGHREQIDWGQVGTSAGAGALAGGVAGPIAEHFAPVVGDKLGGITAPVADKIGTVFGDKAAGATNAAVSMTGQGLSQVPANLAGNAAAATTLSAATGQPIDVTHVTDGAGGGFLAKPHTGAHPADVAPAGEFHPSAEATLPTSGGHATDPATLAAAATTAPPPAAPAPQPHSTVDTHTLADTRTPPDSGTSHLTTPSAPDRSQLPPPADRVSNERGYGGKGHEVNHPVGDAPRRPDEARPAAEAVRERPRVPQDHRGDGRPGTGTERPGPNRTGHGTTDTPANPVRNGIPHDHTGDRGAHGAAHPHGGSPLAAPGHVPAPPTPEPVLPQQITPHLADPQPPHPTHAAPPNEPNPHPQTVAPEPRPPHSLSEPAPEPGTPHNAAPKQPHPAPEPEAPHHNPRPSHPLDAIISTLPRESIDLAARSRNWREWSRTQPPENGRTAPVHRDASVSTPPLFDFTRHPLTPNDHAAVVRIKATITHDGTVTPHQLLQVWEKAHLATDLTFNRAQKLLSGDTLVVDLTHTPDPTTANLNIHITNHPDNPWHPDAPFTAAAQELRSHLGLDPTQHTAPLTPTELRHLSDDIAAANTPARFRGLENTRQYRYQHLNHLEDPAFQHAVQDALRDGNRFLVGADPRNNDYGNLINDGGPTKPGRGNDCLDNALAALSSFHGDPQVAMPRWPDEKLGGEIDDESGELNGLQRAADFLGGQWQSFTGSDSSIPEQFANLHHHIKELGPGSSALVVNEWHAQTKDGQFLYESDGRPKIAGSHATVIVFPPGAKEPVWWDPQASTMFDHPPKNLVGESAGMFFMSVPSPEGVVHAGDPHVGTGATVPGADLPRSSRVVDDRVPVRMGLPGDAHTGGDGSRQGLGSDGSGDRFGDRDGVQIPQLVATDDRSGLHAQQGDRPAAERQPDLPAPGANHRDPLPGNPRHDPIPNPDRLPDQPAHPHNRTPAHHRQDHPGVPANRLDLHENHVLGNPPPHPDRPMAGPEDLRAVAPDLPEAAVEPHHPTADPTKWARLDHEPQSLERGGELEHQVREAIKGTHTKHGDVETILERLAQHPAGREIAEAIASGTLRDAPRFWKVVSDFTQPSKTPGALEAIRLARHLQDSGFSDIEFDVEAGHEVKPGVVAGENTDLDVMARDRAGRVHGWQLKDTSSPNPKNVVGKVFDYLYQIEKSNADYRTFVIDTVVSAAELRPHLSRLFRNYSKTGVQVILRMPDGICFIPPDGVFMPEGAQ
ncbi:hypothetical protein D7D52_23760 [Nocardia yunnanensis]|uniref:Uncharacterized protein n=1 Tax=Nocardia yunnanensis TaxID=2382165 RepID=A0A386ZEN6_9NOCA|nr:toxin glutamine deamidase domain-containing protein [Nocardia yunnanensis]AYF76342.1 hypothetical protein D7D52_23760 [Nocardia yunnanensis]